MDIALTLNCSSRCRITLAMTADRCRCECAPEHSNGKQLGQSVDRVVGRDAARHLFLLQLSDESYIFELCQSAHHY